MNGTLREPTGTRFRVPGLLFLVGFSAIVAQTLLLRESLVVFGGNELAIAVVFAFWLLGTSAGAAAGAIVASRLHRPLTLLLWVVPLPAAMLGPAVAAMRSMRTILAIPAGELVGVPQMALAALAAVMPVSFFVGFAFPTASCAVRMTGASPGGSIGRTYVFEGLGAVLGGAALTFVLLGRLETFRIWYVTVLFVVVGSQLLMLGMRVNRLRRDIVRAVCLLLALCGVAPLAGKLASTSAAARWRATSTSEMVASHDSIYQNIAVGLDQEQYAVYNDGLVGEVFPDDYANRIAAMVVMAEHPEPRKVLVIGSGLAGFVGHILAYPVERLDYVELDPAMFDVLGELLPEEARAACDDARFAAFAVDGRFFIKAVHADPEAIERARIMGAGRFTPCAYDMIIVNLPDPASAMLDRFYTREFYEEAAGIIAPSGVLVTSFTLAENYYCRELWDYAASLYHTLKDVFPHVSVSPPGAPGTGNYLFASRAPGIATDQPDILAGRYESFGVAPTELKAIYESVWPAEKTRFVKRTLEGHPKVVINTDLAPAGFFLYLRLLDKFAGGRFFTVLDRLAGIRSTHVLALLVILLLVRLAYVLATRRSVERHARFNAVAAVAGAGFAAMALEMALVFSFQTTLGYIYRDMGLVVALFMVGLAFGGALATRLVSLSPRTASLRSASSALLGAVGLAVVTGIGVAGLVVVLPSVGSAVLARAVFFAAFGATGVATGFLFPIASKVLLVSGKDVAGAAGAADAADHLGALVGAAAGGVLLVPLVGIVGTCLVAAGVNLVSFALCLAGWFALARRSPGNEQTK